MGKNGVIILIFMLEHWYRYTRCNN